MKVALFCTFLLAAIAASNTLPAHKAIDWRAVNTKIGEIESTVRSAVQQIKYIAHMDNVTVGGRIGSKIDAAALLAIEILEQVNELVRDQELTEAEARELLNELKDILANVQADLQVDLAQLTSTAAGQIRDLFYLAYAIAEEKAQELYALLAAFTTEQDDTNWHLISAIFRVIGTDSSGLFENIKTISGNAEESVKERIYAKVDSADMVANASIQITRDFADSTTLLRRQVVTLETQLVENLQILRENLQGELDQLSTIISNIITNLINNAEADHKNKTEELIKLVPIINWNTVSLKAQEIDELVLSALNQIKTIANEDNEEVGASIGVKVDQAIEGVEVINQHVADRIEEHSLTEGYVTEYMVLLNGLGDLLGRQIFDDLGKLSESVGQKIMVIGYFVLATAQEKSQELIDLLHA